MTELRGGLFITFEGTDGSGKTTQLELLIARLERAGYGVTRTVEPGGTRIGREIRRILLDSKNSGLDPRAELLLYFASRAQNVAEVIRPALASGRVVVCDRSVIDNYAYMKFACGRQPAIERFVEWWMKSYDLLFKVPYAAGPASEDGVRDTDEFFVRSIDQLVTDLLAEKKIRHEVLPVGERPRWVEIVRDVVLGSAEIAQKTI